MYELWIFTACAFISTFLFAWAAIFHKVRQPNADIFVWLKFTPLILDIAGEIQIFSDIHLLGNEKSKQIKI